MDPEERRKRHELSYGVYNFRDVKLHFSRLGWTFRPGPSLSYDHYYIKPGKNPRNKEHKKGVDYFLGEAELVAYARKTKIFGEESVPLPVANRLGRRRRRACSSSSSSAKTSQATLDMNSGGSDDDSKQRPKREHKRHRRRSAESKVGNSAEYPIALSSDSSDDDTSNENNGTAMDEEGEGEEEWAEGDTRGGFDDETSSTSSSEEDTEEDLGIETSSQRSAKSKSQSNGQSQGVKWKENVKAKAKPTEKIKASPEAKPESKSEDLSDDSDAVEFGLSHKSARPLLTTSHRKPNGVMHTSKRQRQNDSKSPPGNAKRSGKPHGRKRSAAVSAQNKRRGLAARVGKKAKSALRGLLLNADNAHDDGGWGDDGDNSFDLGVEECGESPPRRPPSRVHSRANSIRSSPATSVVAASPPPELPDEQKGEAPPAGSIPETTDRLTPAAVSATSHSFPSSSANAASNSAPTPSACAKSNEDNGDTSAQVSMELTQVLLPPDRNNKYHIRVTGSADKPPAHTIWMENLSSHEQREYSFVDVMELPEAKTDLRVPTTAVLTALFRCLSSQPDAIVIVGPEPRATAESKTTFEKGEVRLVTSTAEKNSGEADGGDGLTLVVAYPALDLFWVDHNFPMKLVPTDQRLQHLAKEVKRLREQLHLVQTDRDKLCEQLRQQEENERTLSQQVKAQMMTRMAAQESHPQQRQSSEETERRVAKLDQKKTQTLTQVQEKEKRDRDRARRWVFAQSDWMSAFQPCRALITGADTGTSLLQPGTTAAARKYVVEWKDVVEIAEPFFQPASEGGSTRSITVVKDGVYQVNANVSHDSLVQLRLVLTPARSHEHARPEAREIAPTKVSLYDNKRRVSRVDAMLELRALDQLSLELRLLDSAALASGQEEWLRSPMPTHNRLLVVVLDEHA
ncbi:hypothetical protein PHYPSEUDO_003256 [Phytophthora pseudosyringae]|uniref:Uncharacterized protein n=1 Tax=Phytophthora pseudosyringae TaxID=221518 RepID=A0A8T1VSA3_9STRA|nr:hypothetical protein PHYPSEUDO_003256 [Phytophthora pseudosyringae]